MPITNPCYLKNLKHIVFLSSVFMVSCNHSEQKITIDKKHITYKVDTCIEGVHIQQSGRLPTIQDFVMFYKLGNEFYSSVKHMKQSEKDSVRLAYKRFIAEEFKKKKH